MKEKYMNMLLSKVVSSLWPVLCFYSQDSLKYTNSKHTLEDDSLVSYLGKKKKEEEVEKYFLFPKRFCSLQKLITVVLYCQMLGTLTNIQWRGEVSSYYSLISGEEILQIT